MKEWLLVLVTALTNGSITIEVVDGYDNKPRCEYSAKARKTFFAFENNKNFICLEEPIQSKH